MTFEDCYSVSFTDTFAVFFMCQCFTDAGQCYAKLKKLEEKHEAGRYVICRNATGL